jgi:hypothetical protein
MEFFLSIISFSEPILSFVTVILLVTKLDFQTDLALFSFRDSSDVFDSSSLVNMINSSPTARRLVPYCQRFSNFSTRETSKAIDVYSDLRKLQMNNAGGERLSALFFSSGERLLNLFSRFATKFTSLPPHRIVAAAGADLSTAAASAKVGTV